jgi:hypothetical protein
MTRVQAFLHPSYKQYSATPAVQTFDEALSRPAGV